MQLKTIRAAALVALLSAAPCIIAQDDHDHDHAEKPKAAAAMDDHAGHDHDSHAGHAAEGHDDHAGHDHGESHDDHADHAGHDHGAESHSDEVTLSDAALKRGGVMMGTATMRSLSDSCVAPARVAFNAEAIAHVGSLVDGRATEVLVRQGDHVEQGDVLLRVASPDFGRSQSEFLQRGIEAEVAASAVAPAKEAYERAKKLYDQSQGIALSEVQKREAEYRAATGAEAVARGLYEAAENELHVLGFTQDNVKALRESREISASYAVRAPIGGRVVDREVTLGELVSTDEEHLLVIADTSRLWVLAEVPENRLGDIGVGSAAEIELVSMNGQTLSGEVSLVEAEVDPSSRTARVRVEVDNAQGKLKPGMFARVVLSPMQGGDAVLSIPEQAVQTVEGEPSVFVAVPDEANTFVRRPVAVGRAVNGFVPVLSGLSVDEALVTAGSFILKAELGKSTAEHVH